MSKEIVFPDLEYIYTWNYKYDYMIMGTPIIRSFWPDKPIWEFGFTGFKLLDNNSQIGKVFLKLNGIPDFSNCVIIEKIAKQ